MNNKIKIEMGIMVLLLVSMLVVLAPLVVGVSAFSDNVDIWDAADTSTVHNDCKDHNTDWSCQCSKDQCDAVNDSDCKKGLCTDSSVSEFYCCSDAAAGVTGGLSTLCKKFKFNEKIKGVTINIGGQTGVSDEEGVFIRDSGDKKDTNCFNFELKTTFGMNAHLECSGQTGTQLVFPESEKFESVSFSYELGEKNMAKKYGCSGDPDLRTLCKKFKFNEKIKGVTINIGGQTGVSDEEGVFIRDSGDKKDTNCFNFELKTTFGMNAHLECSGQTGTQLVFPESEKFESVSFSYELGEKNMAKKYGCGAEISGVEDTPSVHNDCKDHNTDWSCQCSKDQCDAVNDSDCKKGLCTDSSVSEFYCCSDAAAGVTGGLELNEESLTNLTLQTTEINTEKAELCGNTNLTLLKSDFSQPIKWNTYTCQELSGTNKIRGINKNCYKQSEYVKSTSNYYGCKVSTKYCCPFIENSVIDNIQITKIINSLNARKSFITDRLLVLFKTALIEYDTDNNGTIEKSEQPNCVNCPMKIGDVQIEFKFTTETKPTPSNTHLIREISNTKFKIDGLKYNLKIIYNGNTKAQSLNRDYTAEIPYETQ